MTSTIAALATAHGVGSIAIVRLSGPQALQIASKITNNKALKVRYAHLCELYNQQQQLIDQAIVIYFKAPHSFTGEDVVEFQLHGGHIVASMLLEELVACGAALAMPGEFSKRAFVNGRLDLSEAEAIAKLIESKSQASAKLLARQVKGELGRFVDAIRHELLELLAHSEVMIDYADEALPDDLIATLSDKLNTTIKKMDEIVASSLRRRGMIEGYKVAIVGRPNAGKSSLLNALLSYDRAIVSDIEGTTRDTIEAAITIGTHLVTLVDTAGIRKSSDSIEMIGVERSKEAIEDADIVVALFDSSRSPSKEDKELIEMLEAQVDKSILWVLNKSDLPMANWSGVVPKEAILLSAKQSITPLEKGLVSHLDSLVGGDELMLISKRQIDSVSEASSQLQEALGPLEFGELEFFSFHINAALKALELLTRPYSNEEMLDKMFGAFCLGK